MKLFIGGDICPKEATWEGFRTGDIDGLFGTVVPLVKSADVFVANLECAITEQDTPIHKMGPNLRAPIGAAETLKKLGMTAVSLSNNHTFDYGQPGFTDTMEQLRRAGILFTGVGETEQAARKPLLLEAGGVKLGFVCVCEHEYSYALSNRQGTWGFDPFETMEDISLTAEKADFTVVLYHGGKEQCEVPSPRLRKACQAMVRAGADLVLCQHSHCIGCQEDYRGSRIIYGEGNFNFVSDSDHPHWKSGLLLEVTLRNGKADYVWHPVVTTATGITLAEGQQKEELLSAFLQRGALLDGDGWLKAWHTFCEENRDYYTRGITGNMTEVFPDMKEDQLQQFFPHFLDCEAHTDVWRELFPSWHGEGTDEIY